MSSEAATLRADLHHLAAECGAKAEVCRLAGQLSASAKLRDAQRDLLEALEQFNPQRDERNLELAST